MSKSKKTIKRVFVRPSKTDKLKEILGRLMNRHDVDLVLKELSQD